MNYKSKIKTLGIKNFQTKYLTYINKKIEILKKEADTNKELAEKEKKFALVAIKISKERANAIRKLIPRKRNTGYAFLELKVNYSETNPIYKYKLETPIFSQFKIEDAEKMIIQSLEETFNLKCTFSKIKDVKNKDEYIFYLVISRIANKEFYRVEFVTTQPLKKEKINLKD